MPRKQTATLPTGETITRRTDRTYTHVVISRGCTAAQRRAADEISLKYQRDDLLARYEATVAKQGHYDHTWEDGRMIQKDGYREYIAGVKAKIAKLEERLAGDPYTAEAEHAFYEATWHQRLDLAQKEASKRAGLQDVAIIPVNEEN